MAMCQSLQGSEIQRESYFVQSFIELVQLCGFGHRILVHEEGWLNQGKFPLL